MNVEIYVQTKQLSLGYALSGCEVTMVSDSTEGLVAFGLL